MALSSKGLGYQIFNLSIRVRVPVGSLRNNMMFFDLNSATESTNSGEAYCWVDDGIIWFSCSNYMGSLQLTENGFERFIEFLEYGSRTSKYHDTRINGHLIALEDVDEDERNLVIIGSHMSMIYNFPHHNLPELIRFLKEQYAER